MDYVLVVLVALAVHRLWIYEEIFQPVQRLLARIGGIGQIENKGKIGNRVKLLARVKGGWKWLIKPLVCPPCFAFWAGAIALFFVEVAKTVPWMNWVVLSLAVYPIVRVAVSVYAWSVFMRWKLGSPGMPVSGQTGSSQSGPGQVKKPCNCRGQGLGLAQAMEQSGQQVIGQTPSVQLPGPLPLVILLTNFYDFERVYSLTTVVLDQAAALARPGPGGPGYRVEIWVQQHCNMKSLPVLPANVTIRDVVPTVTLVRFVRV